MEQRPLGSTGLTVSALGFGCGAVGGLMVRGDAAEQRQAVSRALDAGITYFDTAASYGDGLSEEHLGQVMRDLGAWSRLGAVEGPHHAWPRYADAPSEGRADPAGHPGRGCRAPAGRAAVA